MKLDELLASVPVNHWRVAQIYSLDWHDGPRGGVCALSVPSCEFYFQMVDEGYNPDGLDDRLFLLSELPPGSVAEVLSLVSDFRSRNDTVRRKAELRLKKIVDRRVASSIIILSQDMEHFDGCWKVDPGRTGVKDWFAALGIPRRESA